MPVPSRRVVLASAAVCVLAFAAGCRHPAIVSHERDFRLAGAAPRIVTAGAEITVPLTVENVGTTRWDPARVHLSYHWLWLIPRESIRRSRVLPYHEGIRTRLPSVVGPGGQVAVEGRLLAPTVPGVYWLQWDMVEEGVTWFVQVAPAQPRRLVIVRPPAAMAFAPLPLAVALFGLLAAASLRRHPALTTLVASSDLAWCAAVLLTKPLILNRDALLEPTSVAYWLTVAVALLVPAAALVLPRRVRVWVLTAIGLFATLVIVADILYYRFFGDVLSAPALLAAHQTGRVWQTIRSLLSPGLIWLVADVPFALALAIVLTGLRPDATSSLVRRVAAAAIAAVAVGGAVTAAPRVLARAQLDQMFRNRAVIEQLGAFGFHVYDAWSYARSTLLRPHATPADVSRVFGWFAERTPLRAGAGPLFGAAKGRNVIVIQVESLQDFAVDHVVNGQEVMPHLRRWTSDAIRFTEVTDQTSEGRTSDAEFTTLTSLLPIEHGAVAFRYAGNHYVGLPRVLHDHGYDTLSAVAFEPGFWNREVMHPSYGFAHSLFESDFTMTEQIGWGLNDRDFLQQAIPHLEALRRPFCAWLITLSLHHPFENFPEAHKELKLGALEGTSFGNYLHTMHFFDRALAEFMDGLRARGLLDDSVVVVFGDHDAGFPRDPAIADAIGIGSDEASWALADRIPWFVRVPAANEALRGVRSMPAGQTDMAPTLLSLVGIDAAQLPYMGRNLLGSPDDPPVLRPYGDWIDREHAFFRVGAQSDTCYERATARFVTSAVCSAENERARVAHAVARTVVTEDLQTRIRARLQQGAR